MTRASCARAAALAALGLVCLMPACKTSSSTPDASQAATSSSPAEGESGEPRAREASAAGSEVPAQPDASRAQAEAPQGPAVTALALGTRGQLLIGWADGHVAQARIEDRQGELVQVQARVRSSPDEQEAEGGAEPARVTGPARALSPDARVVLLGEPARRLVRVRDGATVLELRHLERVEGAAFGRGGEVLMLSAPEQLHVWQGVGGLIELLREGVRLEEYVGRQRADFSAGFGPMAGPLAVDGTALAFARPSGQVVWWDSQAPTEAYTIMIVDGVPATLTLRGDVLMATTREGWLRVVSVERRARLPWSDGVRAEQVATSAGSPEGFATLEGPELVWRRLEDGRPTWRQPLGAGDACGLAVGTQRVAACRGGQITVAAIESGQVLARVRRGAEGLVWGRGERASVVESPRGSVQQ